MHTHCKLNFLGCHHDAASVAVELFQLVARGRGVVVGPVEQVGVAGVSRLPQQVLLVALLPEARLSKLVEVVLLYGRLQAT